MAIDGKDKKAIHVQLLNILIKRLPRVVSNPIDTHIDYILLISQNEKNSLSVAWLNMRTTSSLESFNAVLKRSIAKSFNLFKFVARLKYHECRKAERMNNLSHDDLSELHYARRKKKDEEREKKIQKVSAMLHDGQITIGEFLKIMVTDEESMYKFGHMTYIIYYKKRIWLFIFR